jgi:6,7-dimethyl-8-ribityllumazine synthase
VNHIATDLNGQSLSIGIVMSRFNHKVGDALLAACTNELHKHQVNKNNIALVTVPGALEVPLALQVLAQTRKYHALIALGAVVRGETYHFEVVSNESAAGIMQVQLDTGVPVANAILTTENDEQAMARVAEKGADAARVAIEMANLVGKLV